MLFRENNEKCRYIQAVPFSVQPSHSELIFYYCRGKGSLIACILDPTFADAGGKTQWMDLYGKGDCYFELGLSADDLGFALTSGQINILDAIIAIGFIKEAQTRKAVVQQLENGGIKFDRKLLSDVIEKSDFIHQIFIAQFLKNLDNEFVEEFLNSKIKDLNCQQAYKTVNQEYQYLRRASNEH
jgi:hypothetical protein